MKKILYYIYISLVTLMAVSCADDMAEKSQIRDGGDMMLLNGRMSAVDLETVNTRAIDGPSGLGANTMLVFCFDKDGSFLGYKDVTFEVTGNTPDGDASTEVYKFNVTVPSATRRVHFVSNQNMTGFDQSIGANEAVVMTSLESTSGSLTYWARIAVPEDGDLAGEIGNKVIPLVRNQARVELAGDTEGVTFVVCNSYVSGRTVPFNSLATGGEDPYSYTMEAPFITLPTVTTKTIPKGTSTESQQYIFENDNDTEDPVYVILKKEDRFYKVLMADQESNMLPIYRNYRYIIHIGDGALESLQGSDSFQKALEANPCNNPWLYASDELLKISDGNLTMEIVDPDNTTVIYHDAGEYTIKYILTAKDGNIPEPEVTWIPEGASMVGQIETDFSSTNGQGEVRLPISASLAESDKTIYRGTLMIKAGRLTRRVKVLYCNKFKFEPVWVTTGVANKAGQPVVLMFTIPDEFPDELLRTMKFYITTNLLDANGLTPLDIEPDAEVDEECSQKGNDDTNFYAYYTTVRTKGVQRVYFWTRDIPSEVNEEIVCLSAKHFEHMEKTMYFDEDGESAEGVIELVATVPGNPNIVWIPEEINGCAFQYNRDSDTDEYTPINYWLLPRKKDTKYALRFRLKDGGNNTFEDGINLRIYTTHLALDTKAGSSRLEGPEIDANGGGRYYEYTTNKADIQTADGESYYEIKFVAPVNCTEVVRIAHVPEEEEHIHYRSVPLEMANFRAFEFNPEDAGLGYGTVSDDDRNHVAVNTEYGPDKTVDIKFNVSPFKSVQTTTTNPGEGNGTLTVKADPGDDFDIYIKTKNLVPADNIEADVTLAGDGVYKFHYTKGKHAADSGGGTLDNPGGGNITLPFKTRPDYAVSEETVEVYTNRQEIDYTPLRIELGNSPMTGTISYGENDADAKPVPAGAFLVIMRRDGTRIGRFTMTEDGRYSIQLYSEYGVKWEETVYITYESEDKTYWDSGYLSGLLTVGEESGIILTNKELTD